ncbi:MAG: hypothetical protein Q9197_003506 [Variospora fuerteventurae]
MVLARNITIYHPCELTTNRLHWRSCLTTGGPRAATFIHFDKTDGALHTQVGIAVERDWAWAGEILTGIGRCRGIASGYDTTSDYNGPDPDPGLGP